jgi:hypothetical protein
VALVDTTDLAPFLCANWVSLGKVRLAAGEQVFELRLLAKEGEQETAAFDCFLLTRGAFRPNGKLKPGQRWGVADEGYFPFEPDADTFAQAGLDLRGLNEQTAGEHGFVRREGSHFVLGDGKPVRFWAVDVGMDNAAQPRETVDYLARRLAKLGVNMVRCHGPIFRGEDPTKIDERALDDLFYLVAALKRQGIYTTVSFYFPLWLEVTPQLGIPGYEGAQNKRPFALLYFEPRMQEIYRGWARALLTRKNPYTGVPLGKDPAVAIVEIINEDSFFFWTFTKENVPPTHWQRLETMYGAWLTKRYGSLEKAFASWGGDRLPDDGADRAELYEAWHMTADGLRAGGPEKRRRVSDQVRFLTELQRGFYADTVRYFRKELGARNLISCSNWTVADPGLLDGLERYTYTAGDVIDAHGYFEPKQEGEGAGYSVRVGHTFESRAGVRMPEALPLRFVQVADRPQIISELGWTNPNRYRAEATFLAATYGALQGIDGIYFFAVDSNFVLDTGMRKFAVADPVTAGTFPAAALMYRRGDVQEAAAVTEALSVEDLYALRGSALASEAALDELRRRDRPQGEAGGHAGFDPLTFYVGRVARAFDAPETAAEDRAGGHIDRAAQKVTSLTGELEWDYGAGLVRVNAACSQGAAGFLGEAGRIALRDVSIECENEYGTVLVVSLDGRPIAESRRVLIQAMTETQPYGFKTEGNRITAMGGGPLEVKRIAARVTLRMGAGRLRVRALDGNGCALEKSEAALSQNGDGTTAISLDPTAIYHVVEAE